MRTWQRGSPATPRVDHRSLAHPSPNPGNGAPPWELRFEMRALASHGARYLAKPARMTCHALPDRVSTGRSDESRGDTSAARMVAPPTRMDRTPARLLLLPFDFRPNTQGMRDGWASACFRHTMEPWWCSGLVLSLARPTWSPDHMPSDTWSSFHRARWRDDTIYQRFGKYTTLRLGLPPHLRERGKSAHGRTRWRPSYAPMCSELGPRCRQMSLCSTLYVSLSMARLLEPNLTWITTMANICSTNGEDAEADMP